MNKNSKVILLEFNELCPPLMDRFIAAGELPNFKRLRDESQTFVTDAEEQQETLEPWIQWVTLHTGLSYEQHGVFNLGDAHKLEARSIWDSLSEANLKVWICGSMNVKYQEPLNGLVLPDAWSNRNIPCSEPLLDYCNFVRTQVQEHTNESVALSKAEYAKVLGFLLSHGLSFATVRDIALQLFNEIRGDRWKRAVILDKLQWDVFAHFYRKTQPNFSTFFSNSVAHFQHKYWRNMEPELFDLKPSEKEQAMYRDAILFAYKETDKLVGRAFALAGQEATLVLATALSQQPYLAAEGEGGKHFYRPKNFDRFVEALGLKGVKEVAPVMSEEFHIYFDSAEHLQAAEQVLDALRVDGRALMRHRREDNSLFVGCQIFDKLEQGAQMQLGKEEQSFFELFYQADSIKSGMHHPDGLFWVRSPAREHSSAPSKLPLRAIAPALLAHFGLPSEPGMDDLSAGIKF